MAPVPANLPAPGGARRLAAGRRARLRDAAVQTNGLITRTGLLPNPSPPPMRVPSAVHWSMLQRGRVDLTLLAGPDQGWEPSATNFGLVVSHLQTLFAEELSDRVTLLLCGAVAAFHPSLREALLQVRRGRLRSALPEGMEEPIVSSHWNDW